jgi:hypothetical protein
MTIRITIAVFFLFFASCENDDGGEKPLQRLGITFGNVNESEYMATMIADAGHIVTIYGAYQALKLAKVSTAGLVQWERALPNLTYVSGLFATNDGGYLVVGTRTIDNQYAMTIRKFGSTGNPVWSRDYSSVNWVGRSMLLQNQRIVLQTWSSEASQLVLLESDGTEIRSVPVFQSSRDISSFVETEAGICILGSDWNRNASLIQVSSLLDSLWQVPLGRLAGNLLTARDSSIVIVGAATEWNVYVPTVQYNWLRYLEFDGRGTLTGHVDIPTNQSLFYSNFRTTHAPGAGYFTITSWDYAESAFILIKQDESGQWLWTRIFEVGNRVVTIAELDGTRLVIGGDVFDEVTNQRNPFILIVDHEGNVLN